MFRRIRSIDPASQHRNGAPLRGQRASMGRRINSARQPTHHRYTSRCQVVAQLFGYSTSGCRRAPGAHDGHCQLILLSQCARDVQERRRIRNHLQPCRILRVQQAPDFNALSLDRLEFPFDAPAGGSDQARAVSHLPIEGCIHSESTHRGRHAEQHRESARRVLTEVSSGLPLHRSPADGARTLTSVLSWAEQKLYPDLSRRIHARRLAEEMHRGLPHESHNL